jgi:hypothetical protein
MKTVYISGPMTGRTDYNFPAFHAKEYELKKLGYKVINPARRGTEEDDRRALLSWDMQQVCKADFIYMLTGWEHSTGARAEWATALAANLGFMYE